MNFLIVFALVTVTAARHINFNPSLDEPWRNFKSIFSKTYSEGEEIGRRLIWEKRVVDIIRHNFDADMGLRSFRMGINEFSDFDHDEFVRLFNGYTRPSALQRNVSAWFPRVYVQIPGKVDWRDEGYVTPIKNSGICGSCWAFSATGSLEGQHFKKTGKLVSLSEQNLVDCSKPEGNDGCGGGNMHNAFEYIYINKGIDTEESYPYTAQDGECRFKRENVGATITGTVDLPAGDENVLKEAVATIGPISVAIDASHESFMAYQDGIYEEEDCSSETLDHGVLVVGYGTEDGADYWLVKNSWGLTWGNKGYVKMARNKKNMCGIATLGSYPLV